jgi:ABC transporter substrate binding protein
MAGSALPHLGRDVARTSISRKRPARFFVRVFAFSAAGSPPHRCDRALGRPRPSQLDVHVATDAPTRLPAPLASNFRQVELLADVIAALDRIIAGEAVDHDEGDLSRAFELAVRQHVDGLVIGADGLTQMHQQTIVDWLARNRLPAVFPAREFVEAGGLIAYAVNYPDLYLQLATFVDKIFKGTKPGELPVQQPTKFELVINLKTAKALGLEIPPTLIARADEVIE